MHRLPPMVPAFWIWVEPTSAAACFNPSKAGGRSAFATSLQSVVAPKRQAVAPREIPRSPAIPVRSKTGPGKVCACVAAKRSVYPAASVTPPPAAMITA